MTWDITDPNVTNFYYDYRTTTTVDCDLDIYNWDTTEWLQLESNTLSTNITGSYDLSDPFISGSNEVKVRFQSTGSFTNFDMEIDQAVCLLIYNLRSFSNFSVFF